MQTNTIKIGSITLISGLILGALAAVLLLHTSTQKNTSAADGQAEQALHWVAPMDPNYIRDKPGKSPMGMDLVPVYASELAQDAPGTVFIQANVINNLGVKTAKVSSITPEKIINTLGTVRYNEEALVHVHARVEGWVEELFVNSTGSYVKKGEPLYSLYSPALVNAQEEYLLARQRNNSGLIKAAKARLRAMQVSEKTLKIISDSKTIQQNVAFYSPQNGFIEELDIREGFFVKPSDTMMAIGGLDEVWVDAEIMAKDASKISLNQAVTMTLPFIQGKEFMGKIDYIYPSLNTISRTLTARIRFENEDFALKPNMFADVAIDVSNHYTKNTREILAVPTSAVIRTGNQNRVVLALGDGKFKSIEVTIGEVFEQHIEIISGLVDGDEVVISAQFLLDSESSISSDFMRMLPTQSEHETEAVPEQEQSTWTQASINQVMVDDRMLNLTHGELTAWNMPGMTMNFTVAEHVNMSSLREGMQIHIEVIKSEKGMYMVNTIHFMDTQSGHSNELEVKQKEDMSAKPSKMTTHDGGH